jgi:pSer/pThr/pTyr-binding forkhead associated (FHA) protein
VNRSSLVGLPAVVMVVAARCGAGHLSPAYAGTCRVCGAPIPPQQPVEIPRPTLGQLRLSTGGIVPLDRPLILGRNPRIPPGYAAEQPNLVRLPDPEKDVSGQHLEVTLDYWNVLVRDLGSTNGTEVILPGAMPVALRANDPVIIEPGTRVVLAGTISFTFEVLP